MTSEENARSKQLLLAAIDDSIETMLLTGAPMGLVDSFIMNRNRVAKLFDLSTKRKQQYGRPSKADQD